LLATESTENFNCCWNIIMKEDEDAEVARRFLTEKKHQYNTSYSYLSTIALVVT